LYGSDKAAVAEVLKVHQKRLFIFVMIRSLSDIAS